MGNVRKGPAVDNCRGMFKGLDQVRLHGILQKRCHGPHCLQILCRHRFSLIVVCHDHPSQPFLQIFHILRKTEHRHNFRRNRNDKMVFSYSSIGFCPKSHHNIAQNPVVHVKASFPHHLSGVNGKLVSLLDMIVQNCCQQIVGRGDGMEIPCKMKVQILHGNYLREAASCGSPFYPKAGA